MTSRNPWYGRLPACPVVILLSFLTFVVLSLLLFVISVTVCQGSVQQDDYAMPQDAAAAAGSDDEEAAAEEDVSYEAQTGASAEDQLLYSDEVRVLMLSWGGGMAHGLGG